MPRWLWGPVAQWPEHLCPMAKAGHWIRFPVAALFFFLFQLAY